MRPGNLSLVGFLLLLLCGTAPPALAQIVLYDIPGTVANESLGYWVSGVGDVNGDGLEDFAAGGFAGAKVYSGADASLLHEFHLTVTHAVAGAGDVNGDGYDDVIVGDRMDSQAGFWAGTAAIYNGRTGALLGQAFGDSPGDSFGFAVDGAGDVNGDGYADLVVGAPYADSAAFDSGDVFVIFGPSGANGHVIRGTQAYGYLGYAVSGAGDVDGDGLDDIVVGEPGHYPSGGSPDTGAVRVFRGFDGAEIFSQAGMAGGDRLGHSVADATDIDGDGFADVVAGAPFSDSPDGPDFGQVWVIRGPSGTIYCVTGTGGAYGHSGEAVLGPGDRDGDGKGDFVYGAPGIDGIPHMYSTPDIGNRWVEGERGTLFAQALGKADVNGDGRQDTIIGKPMANGGMGGVEVWLTCVRSWSNYGFGWPGTQGIPSLTLDKPPWFDADVTLHVDNSLGYATLGFLGLGLTEASIPTNFGGTLLLIPDEVHPLAIPAGGLDMPATLAPPDPVWCHLTVHGQVFMLDHNATHGWSMTPGIKIKLGTNL